jgi:hypothetical protein
MNTQALLTAVLFLGFLCLCEVAGYTAILAFILGIIFTLVLVVVGVMVGLQTAETAVRKAKDKELAKKTDFPAIEEVRTRLFVRDPILHNASCHYWHDYFGPTRPW